MKCVLSGTHRVLQVLTEPMVLMANQVPQDLQVLTELKANRVSQVLTELKANRVSQVLTELKANQVSQDLAGPLAETSLIITVNQTWWRTALLRSWESFHHVILPKTRQ
jgi:hypothetical protein